MTEDPTFFGELCTACEDRGLTVGILVYEHANKKNHYQSKLRIVVNRGKTRLVEFKQTKYGWPTVEELAQQAIDELKKRGHIDQDYDDA